MNHLHHKLLFLLVLVGISLSSCKKDPDPIIEEAAIVQDFDNEVALDWMSLYLDVERFTPGYRPPVSARTMGYMGLTAYEALVDGMPGYQSLKVRYSDLATPPTNSNLEYHWPTVLNAAYAKSFERFFPTAPFAQAQAIQNLKRKYESQYNLSISSEVFSRSQAHGIAIAEAVYDWSRTDVVGHEAYLKLNDPNYVPPTTAGHWQPTFPDYTPALLPNWGQVRTFVATQDDAIKAPLAYSTLDNSEIYVQAKEVMVKVDRIKAGFNDSVTDEWIADFWSDDCPTKTFTPAARWLAIGNQAVDAKNANLQEAVIAYARVGMALSDAGVRCWNEKYRYGLQRPIDYIRQAMNRPDWNTIMCPTSNNFITPPFPAYPSGHATFGAAAAEVLGDVFGYSFPMVDRCHEGRVEFRSEPRAFDNFAEMAEENAYSRIPLGVHFRMDAETGLDLGRRIGAKVNRLPWKR